MLIWRVDSATAAFSPDGTGPLHIHAEGLTRTAIWTDPELIPRAPATPFDGVLEFDFVADESFGVMDAIWPIKANYIYMQAPDGVTHVRITTETNALLVPVTR
jgi:hypothetical protein